MYCHVAGNLLGIIVLAWAGACGHTPVALLGGATGRVGDPSGRSSERPVLSEAEIQRNIDGEAPHVQGSSIQALGLACLSVGLCLALKHFQHSAVTCTT